jgi:hypothetical protein
MTFLAWPVLGPYQYIGIPVSHPRMRENTDSMAPSSFATLVTASITPERPPPQMVTPRAPSNLLMVIAPRTLRGPNHPICMMISLPVVDTGVPLTLAIPANYFVPAGQ